jgi:hypothetical protein
MLFDALKVFILFLFTSSLSFFISFQSFPLFLILSITWMKPQMTFTEQVGRSSDAVDLYFRGVLFRPWVTDCLKGFPVSFQVNAVVVP